jgi:hypothetical protein
LLEIADERVIFEGEGKSWLKWQLERFGKILTQVIVDSGRDAALRRLVGAARRPYRFVLTCAPESETDRSIC